MGGCECENHHTYTGEKANLIICPAEGNFGKSCERKGKGKVDNGHDHYGNYVKRVPKEVLHGEPHSFLKSVVDAAGLIGSNLGKIIIEKMPTDTSNYEKSRMFLGEKGFLVDVKSITGATVVPTESYIMGCIDSRHGDRNPHNDISRLSHPAALALLHPEVQQALQARGLDHHEKYLREVLENIKASRKKIKGVVFHAGGFNSKEDIYAPGCGGMGMLNSLLSQSQKILSAQQLLHFFLPLLESLEKDGLIDSSNFKAGMHVFGTDGKRVEGGKIDLLKTEDRERFSKMDVHA